LENFALKIFNIGAMILVQGKGNLSREHLTHWKNNYTRIAVIHPDRDSEEKMSGKLKGVIEFGLTPEKGSAAGRQYPGNIIKAVLQKLDVPAKSVVLAAEDPQYIASARRMRLAMVIGIREQSPGKRALYEKGANIVLEKLEDIAVYQVNGEACSFTQNLPNVFTDLNKFETPFRDREPVFFLDYDGTLTPIVKDPACAVLPDHTRDLLRGLAQRYTVAVVSGRDMDDIKKFISLDRMIYAGSHGFRISGPDGLYMEHKEARALLDQLDQFEAHLRNTVAKEIEGVQVERKHFAIAIHYRNAPPKSLERIRKEVDRLIAGKSEFKKGRGKKILEIKPALDWHKGKAVEWLIDKLELSDPEKYIPVYIGDDVTDEDAFRTLSDEGIGILVGSHSLPSAAHYQLKDVDQVNKFLHYLVHSAESL
jgi:trehalose 6-phosphate phosphatase